MAELTFYDLLASVLNAVRLGEAPPISILRLLLSKALGFGILTFSFVVKLPQIVALSRSRSADGLAPVSFELEEVGLCIHTAYGFLNSLPFHVYGEAAIICLQNTYLLAQIYKFSNAPIWRSASLFLGLVVALSAVTTGLISQPAVKSAYELNNAIFIAARVPQIFQNFKAGSTGQLSSITAFANFAGCIARIFTSVQEGGGAAMIRGYILGTLLNGVIFFQIVFYSSRKHQNKRTEAEKAK